MKNQFKKGYKYFAIIVLVLFLPLTPFAKVLISGKIINLPDDQLSIDFPLAYQLNSNIEVKKTFSEFNYSIELELKQPAFARIKCSFYQFNLLLSPDTEMEINFDAKDIRNTITVNGNPANQFYILSKCNSLAAWTATERGPDPISTIVSFLDLMDQEKALLSQFNISKDLQVLLSNEIEYFFINQMLLLTRDYNSADRPLYMTEIDQILSNEVVNRLEALSSPSYQTFHLNHAGYYWNYKSEAQKKEIYPEFENKSQTGILPFFYAFWKAFNTPPIREAILVNNFLQWQDYMDIENTIQIYEAYTKEYPKSKYLSTIKQALAPLLDFWNSDNLKEGDQQFISSPPNSIEELLSNFEEKIVIIFVWTVGMDFNNSTKKSFFQWPKLQEKLSDENVQYLFMGINYGGSENQQKNWEKTIHTFKLKGHHLFVPNDHPLKKEFLNLSFQNLRAFPPALLIFDRNGVQRNLFRAAPLDEKRITILVEHLKHY